MKKKIKEVQNKKIPIGIIIISIFYFIISFIELLAFLFLFVLGKDLVDILFKSYFSLFGLAGGVFLILSVIFLIFSVLGIIIAIGLLKSKNWARIIGIIYSGLLIYASISIRGTGFFIFDIIFILINLGIIVYLLVKRED